MDAQTRVAAFVQEHDLDADPEYRLLDLSAEIGEIAADAVKSSEYGAAPEELTVSSDELGDALFALLATADELDIDAGAALDQSLRKYERRIDESGDAGSA